MLTQLVSIVQADMRVFSGLGCSVKDYNAVFVRHALEDAGIDPDTQPVSPDGLIVIALMDLCQKALEQ